MNGNTSNLIIVGNGFDLAHGLKTSYSDFLKYLIKTEYDNLGTFQDLFTIEHVIRAKYPSFEDYFENFNYKTSISTESEVLTTILYHFPQANWCDIEQSYYSNLLSLAKPGLDPKYVLKLNNEFQKIKSYLQDYLLEQEKSFDFNPVYSEFFNLINSGNTLVLNFNYTNTVQNYVDGFPGIELNYIHGRLKDENNPIIFGYAANHQESRKLISLNDPEYLRNIKKHCYKRTNLERQLITYMNNHNKFDVFVLGHSCGLSDKLILNEIFNHRNLGEIRVSHYENYEHYRNIAYNIDRIMDNDENFKKLANFDLSLKIPQKGELKNGKLAKYLAGMVDIQTPYKGMKSRII